AAVLGEADERIMIRERIARRRFGGAAQDHEFSLGSAADVRVAQIDRRPLEQSCGFPGLAVGRGEDANFPWSRGVAGAFAEDAEPAILEANQIGERVVRRLVPNL